MMNKKRISLPTGTLKIVLSYLSPHRLPVAMSIVLSAASVALTLYVPILIGRAIDQIVGPDSVGFAAITPLLVRTACVAAAATGLQWLIGVINNKVTFEVVRDVRNRAFEKLEILPIGYIDSHQPGELVSRVIADVDQFADGLLLGFSNLFTGAVTILGTLAFMLSIQPAIAAAVVLLTPLSFVVAKFIASRTYAMFREQSETRGEQTAFIDEAVGGQKLIRAFAHEKQAAAQFDEINDRLERCSVRAIFYSSLTNPCTRFVNGVVYAVVALFGALLCVSQTGIAGAFTVGSLAALLSYANQYTKPFNEISGVITELQNAFACAARIFELIDETPQPPDSSDALVLEQADGSVHLNNVSFSYSKERRLIKNLSFLVKPGQRIAIVGPTGCGKTTLINLLMRFYDVNSGAVLVDGVDVRRITRKSLRANYGMVLQETWIKSGTIRDNIAIGREGVTDDEIIAAAKNAHADGFICRLPQGYGTMIGEDGGSLSQGQKQLLCIARVMLCLPPMLILDEATASIDTRTELRIQNAFAAMMKGRTSFIVAHRLSTIREADVILVMRDGDVIEQGSHDELMKMGGFYSKLYNSQFAGQDGGAV